MADALVPGFTLGLALLALFCGGVSLAGTRILDRRVQRIEQWLHAADWHYTERRKPEPDDPGRIKTE